MRQVLIEISDRRQYIIETESQFHNYGTARGVGWRANG